jgi:drug/metabolite transporter (DMT)-like permease
MVLVVILYALFALTFAAGKKALLYGSPLALVCSRTIFTTLLLLPFYFLKNKKIPKLNLKQFWNLLVYSLVTLVSLISASWALLHIASIKVALFYALTPLITALISYLCHNEFLNKYKIGGMIIGLIGIFAIAISGADQASIGIHLPGWPELILTIAVTAYSVGWFLVHPLIAKHNFSPIYINGLSSLIGGLICTLIMIITQTPIPVASSFWIWSSIQVVFSSVICYSLYMHLLKQYSTNLLAFACFLEPIFAAVYGWILLGEVPSVVFCISTILISIGLYLFYIGEITSKKHHDSLFQTYND